MSTCVQVVGNSETRVWGMTGRDRLERMLEKIDGAKIISPQLEPPPGAPVVFLRGDHLYDERILCALIGTDGEFVLYERERGVALAIRTTRRDINLPDDEPCPGVSTRVTTDELVNPYDAHLKKHERARVWRIERDNRDFLERALFSRAYKGVTDLVTRWVWPVPARWATKFCAERHLKPNQVTLLSLLLAVLSGVAFWYGAYAIGLALGWFMTFLDTVDGKLARVTLTSSRFGDILDHGLDLIHPPLWYIAWGAGLSAQGAGVPWLQPLMVLMLAAYVGGRLCEGIFQAWIASFPIFVWQPIDSLSRLITARRNPNLLILSAGLFAGRPDAGLALVVIWHLLCTLFLAVRLGQGWKAKQAEGALVSWLQAVGPGTIERGIWHDRLAMKIFI